MLHKSGVDELIEDIRAQHRRRCFAMEQRKRVNLALGAFVRLMLGWHAGLPEKERAEIRKRAAALIADGGGAFHEEVTAARMSAEPWRQIEKFAAKAMALAAEQLPVWSTFGKSVRGFGEVSLAVIVGEAGDLANYSTEAKLWKRMGLAVLDGKRQGNPGDGASKEVWIAHGYNPSRRSRVWNIGDALIKGNRDGKYRTLYLARKEIELARGLTKLHAHRRAQRYMEKRLLRDLWKAWLPNPTDQTS